MANFFTHLGAFLLALGVLVVVHEMGHYLAARVCGVKVLRFSFGFGKILFSRRLGRDQTEWVISAFPLGGYVKMLDEREGEVASHELARTFNRQSVAKRAFVVAAGPLANFLLAILLSWGLLMVGAQEFRPLLGTPEPASEAATAGITNGDLVLSINGKSIQTWEELRWQVMQQIVDRETVVLEVLDSDQRLTKKQLNTTQINSETLDKNPLGELGFAPYRPRMRAIVGNIQSGSPAEVGGLLAGDEVISLNTKPITDWSELVLDVRKSPGQILEMGVLRGNAMVTLRVIPNAVDERGVMIGRMGAGLKEDAQLREKLMVKVAYGPGAAMQRALIQTWETSALTVRMIGRMLIGELSLKNLSGPVTIADYAGQSARLGLSYYLKFLALISISLGVLNLLPIPVLDGGHLLYYSIEVVKGSPLSERVIERTQQLGMALLLLMMASAMFNDINRLFFG